MSGLSYLQELATSFPAEEKHFTELSEYFKDRLWFQLTGKLMQLLSEPHFAKPPHLLDLYEKFVKGFQNNLNQLELAQFAVAASRQHTDFKMAKQFLNQVSEAVSKDIQAHVLCDVELMCRMIKVGQLDDCGKLIESVKANIEKFPGIMDAVVQSAYYKSQFLYAKAKDEPTQIFKNALLFLSYTPIQSIPEGEQADFAFDVSMAALVGKEIFNFGELLERPMIKVLDDSKHSWALGLLNAFNEGDIKKYEQIISENKTAKNTLAAKLKFLNMKVRIMRLMETVFKRSTQEREIDFKDIAASCDTGLDQVEYLLMKAFSLNVMKGVIDQVSQKVTVTWVQPRVLSMDQVKEMSKRLKVWSKEVQEATASVEENSAEMLQH